MTPGPKGVRLGSLASVWVGAAASGLFLSYEGERACLERRWWCWNEANADGDRGGMDGDEGRPASKGLTRSLPSAEALGVSWSTGVDGQSFIMAALGPLSTEVYREETEVLRLCGWLLVGVESALLDDDDGDGEEDDVDNDDEERRWDIINGERER